jgi:diaminopimelate decarboxylase
LEVLAEAAAAEGVAEVALSLRLNPHVDAGTHAYITTGTAPNKFGMARPALLAVAGRLKTEAALSRLRLVGLHSHIGSQLLDVAPLGAAARVVVAVAQELEALLGRPLLFINMVPLAPRSSSPPPYPLQDCCAF